MKSKAPGSEERGSEGRFAYEGLDRVIHERARLSVLTSLITNPKGLTFGDLKQLCVRRRWRRPPTRSRRSCCSSDLAVPWITTAPRTARQSLVSRRSSPSHVRYVWESA